MMTFIFYRKISDCNKYLILFIAVFLFHSTHISAKNISDSIETFRTKAIKYDKNRDIYNAIEYYSKYLSYKNKDFKLTYRLANLYFDARDYSKANQYYDSVIKLKRTKYPLTYYRKGIVCLNLEKYDEAIDAFTKFRKLYKENNDNYRKLAVIYTESSEWAKSHMETDGVYNVTHLGINHSNIDFSPFPLDDHTIIYGTVSADTSRNGNPVRQIYKAVKNNGQWKSLGLLKGEVNNPEFNTGNAVVTDDGKRLFFTRIRKNWKDADISEIYVSHFDGNQWQTPERLPYPVNDENYTTTQPAIGKNLKTGNDILYFVSDRPGGKGGLDIWYTEYNKKTDTYKEPLDLDKGVNTIDDECCPFYDNSTGTLYFSSKGRKNGLGGYDIYKGVGSAKKWTEALPLPKPINSSYDDYYFSILRNNKEGFFTSNRPGSMTLGGGSCCDDIFSFKINECVRIYSWGTVKNSVNPDFYNHLNEKYHLGLVFPENDIVLSEVPVELYLSGEKDDDETLISKTMTDENGNYNFELDRNKHYKVLVKNYGYFEKKVPVNTFGVNCSDTIGVGTTLINYLPKANVRINIYYDHDKFKLSDSARRTIDTALMPLFDLFPNAIVEIGSHTDSTGTDLYNIKLSQKRSESVVSYLISKGIPSERLVAKGYGMRFPIAPNTNSDGSDNLAGMQLNRRTEIKVVGEITTFNKDE
jgi:outer membrane protein OmpA-like peptidoglycan-associated protein